MMKNDVALNNFKMLKNLLYYFQYMGKLEK